jgi:glucosamine--fructose-6-phosphate aminotransferase (isomerizing)
MAGASGMHRRLTPDAPPCRIANGREAADQSPPQPFSEMSMSFTDPGHSFASDIRLAMAHSLDFPNLRRVVDEHVARAVDDPRIAEARRIVIGGSGDSLFAGLCVAPAFRRWTGLPVEGRTALELARYDIPLLGPGDLVISVSNSGSSSRAREAVLLAKSRGCATLGVTGSLTGPLAAQADRIIHRPVHEQFDLPASYGRCFLNMAEFIAVLYGLYAFGLALGVKRGHLEPAAAEAHMAEIVDAVAAIPAISAAIEPGIAALAEQLDGIDTIWAIGAGPSQGTARYCAAKFHEQMPINGIPVDLEEWAHLEYFLTLAWGRRSVVMVIAPPGNSLDRAQEIVTGIASAGGRAIVVTESALTPFPEATARFDLGFAASEFISPVFYHLPAQLLVLHMARRAGVTRIPLHRQDTAWLIAKGIVRDSAAGLE